MKAASPDRHGSADPQPPTKPDRELPRDTGDRAEAPARQLGHFLFGRRRAF